MPNQAMTAGQTMTAVVLAEFGGPGVLRPGRVPVPEPAAGEVLVRVRAVGINPPDWYAREGMPDVPAEVRPVLDLPLVPGTDVSGEVVALGAGVDAFAVGDAVNAMVGFPEPMQAGAYAEYVSVSVSDLARLPDGVDHVIASALPMAGLTAWQYLVELGHHQPSPFQAVPHRPVPLDGATVLVNGAAGGVGHLALQLARAQGARVVAVASGGHEAFLRELGAERVVDYTRQSAAEVVSDVDLVLDAVGGAGADGLLTTLRPGGAYFPLYPGPLEQAVVTARRITVSATQVRADGGQLTRLNALVAAGSLRVAVDSTYPLTDAAAAHARAARGHLRGKLVLTVP